jgi:hypothetical protein
MAKKFTQAERDSANAALDDATRSISQGKTKVAGIPPADNTVTPGVINDLHDAKAKIAGALADLGGRPCGGGRPC